MIYSLRIESQVSDDKRPVIGPEPGSTLGVMRLRGSRVDHGPAAAEPERKWHMPRQGMGVCP
jgi:hypothetical protein